MNDQNQLLCRTFTWMEGSKTFLYSPHLHVWLPTSGSSSGNSARWGVSRLRSSTRKRKFQAPSVCAARSSERSSWGSSWIHVRKSFAKGNDLQPMASTTAKFWFLHCWAKAEVPAWASMLLQASFNAEWMRLGSSIFSAARAHGRKEILRETGKNHAEKHGKTLNEATNYLKIPTFTRSRNISSQRSPMTVPLLSKSSELKLKTQVMKGGLLEELLILAFQFATLKRLFFGGQGLPASLDEQWIS